LRPHGVAQFDYDLVRHKPALVHRRYAARAAPRRVLWRGTSWLARLIDEDFPVLRRRHQMGYRHDDAGHDDAPARSTETAATAAATTTTGIAGHRFAAAILLSLRGSVDRQRRGD